MEMLHNITITIDVATSKDDHTVVLNLEQEFDDVGDLLRKVIEIVNRYAKTDYYLDRMN